MHPEVQYHTTRLVRVVQYPVSAPAVLIWRQQLAEGCHLRYSHPCFNMYGNKHRVAELPIGWLWRMNLGVR